MPKKIGSYEAKTKLPEILRRVEAGESFTITNRGKPVVDVVPSRSDGRSRVQTVIDTILAARKHPVSDQALAEFRQTGRK